MGSRTRQPCRLRQARQVHAPGAVPQHRVEIHPALVAISEGERERAPEVIDDLIGIEIRNPAPPSGEADRGNGCRIAAIGAHAYEPRLLSASRVEREPSGKHTITWQDFHKEAMPTLRRVVPGTGKARAYGAWRSG